MTPPILAAFAATAGACVGSYIATAAMRGLRAEQGWAGRSHCDACGVALSFAQTAPLISYARLGGSCSACGARIDPMHLVGEAVGAAGVGLSFLVFPIWQATLLAGLALALLASSLIDAKTRRLPDVVTILISGLSGMLALIHGLSELWLGLAAALATLVILEGLRRTFIAVKQQAGLGLGDVKLMGALAIWLGFATSWVIVAASAAGLGFYALTRPKDPRIPFGPFIAASAWILGFGREAHWWLSQN